MSTIIQDPAPELSGFGTRQAALDAVRQYLLDRSVVKAREDHIRGERDDRVHALEGEIRRIRDEAEAQLALVRTSDAGAFAAAVMAREALVKKMLEGTEHRLTRVERTLAPGIVRARFQCSEGCRGPELGSRPLVSGARCVLTDTDEVRARHVELVVAHDLGFTTGVWGA